MPAETSSKSFSLNKYLKTCAHTNQLIQNLFTMPYAIRKSWAATGGVVVSLKHV